MGYTVIGLYNDGQTFAYHVAAANAYAAMALVAIESGRKTDLQILGAIEGEHALTPACDESGNAAYASDLAALDEDDGEPRCTNPEGHEFTCTGTAYGGDDESYHGEGRSYCIHCGADGDG